MKTRYKLLSALLAALLLGLGWLGVSGLPMLVGLVPLMMVSGAAGDSRRAAWGVFGFVALAFGLWSAATTWWIWIAAPIGAILSVIITVGLMGGAFMLWHYVSKRGSKWLAYVILIAAWIAGEHLYTVGEFSFPWLTLGNGFAHDIRLVQWYDTTGVFGGTLWALLCNILVYEVIRSRGKRCRVALACVVLLPVTVSLIKYYTYGTTRTAEQDTALVTVVQPNIDPYTEKYSLNPDAQLGLLAGLIAQAPADVQFIVTPETSIGTTLREEMLGDSGELAALREVVRERFPQAMLILGASTARFYNDATHTDTAHDMGQGLWYDNFNSVLGVDSSARVQLRHKSLLVIGAEKTPYHKYLRNGTFLAIDLGGFMGQCGFDPEPHVFRTRQGMTVGAAVCYEGVYGGYMGGFPNLGAQIIFIISNDGWWGDTSGYRQLFAFSRLRAVEMRRSIARSANTGMSGFITPRGEVTQSLGWDRRGVLTDRLPLEEGITFYVRYGDYVGRMAWYLLGFSVLCFVALRIRDKRKPTTA